MDSLTINAIIVDVLIAITIIFTIMKKIEENKSIKRITKYTHQTIGKITKCRKVMDPLYKREEKPVYFYTYQYIVENKTYEITEKIGRINQVEIGTETTVYYNKDNPSTSCILPPQEKEKATIYNILSKVFLIITIILISIFLII